MDRIKSKLHLHCLMVAVLIITLVPFLTGFDITRHVFVEVDGIKKELRTNAATPQEILKEAGVVLATGDAWRLKGANKRVQDGSVIQVVRAIPFIVIRGEETKEYKSAKATVGEALKSVGISYRKERVYPEPHSALEAGMQIFVLGKD